MQSTLPQHQTDRWDRVGAKSPHQTHGYQHKYYRPHSYFQNESTVITKYQKEIAVMLESKILMITAEQNVPEWFISQIFRLTASPAQQYLSLGLKDKDFEIEEHWVAINEYATNNPTSIPIPVATTYQIARSDAME